MIENKDNFFIQSMSESSKITKVLGQIHCKNGQSIEDNIKVSSISLWSAMEVSLALFTIPNAISDKYTSWLRNKEFYVKKLRSLKNKLHKYGLWPFPQINNSEANTWPQGDIVIFLCFSWYLARDLLLPIAEIMKRDGNYTPVVLLIEKDGSVISGNLSVRSILNNGSAEDLIKAKRYIKENRKNISKNLNREVISKSLSTRTDEEVRKITKAIKEHLNRGSFDLSYLIAIGEKILANKKPKAIFSIDVADPRTRIFTQLAQNMNIPSVQVQVGPIDQSCAEWYFCHDDLIAVQGPEQQRVLAEFGLPLNRLVVTGSPRYDNLTEGSADEKISLRQRFNIPATNKTIILASCYHLPAYGKEALISLNEMKKSLFDAVLLHPEISLIVKPHPLENVEQTKSFVVANKNIIFATRSENITKLTRCCDGLISFGSTATYESLVLGKPTACLDFQGWEFSKFFTTKQVVSALRTNTDITQFLSDLSINPHLRSVDVNHELISNFLNDKIGFADNKAARRICDLINTIK